MGLTLRSSWVGIYRTARLSAVPTIFWCSRKSRHLRETISGWHPIPTVGTSIAP